MKWAANESGAVPAVRTFQGVVPPVRDLLLAHPASELAGYYRSSLAGRSGNRETVLSDCVLVHLHRAPRLVTGVANVFQRALGAFRLASDTKLAAVPDDLV
jgi:hypothetical protein